MLAIFAAFIVSAAITSLFFSAGYFLLIHALDKRNAEVFKRNGWHDGEYSTAWTGRDGKRWKMNLKTAAIVPA